MLDQTDVFEVLSFEDQQEAQQTKVRLEESLSLPQDSHQPFNPQKTKNTQFLLNVPNEFEEQYHQPIRKRSLQAYMFEEEMHEDEDAVKIELRQWTAEIINSQEGKKQQKNVVRSMFHESYFCQNRINHCENRTKMQQNMKNKSNLITIPSPLKTQNCSIRVAFLHKQDKFFWHFEAEIEINIDIIKAVYDEMLLKECFVPIFSFHKYSEWQKAKSKNKESSAQAQKILKVYLQSYTAFLNHYFSQDFKTVICSLCESKASSWLPNLSKKLSKDGKRYSQELCENRFDISSLIEGIYQIIVSSKSQILRKILLQKIRSLSATRKECEHLQMIDYGKLLFQKEQKSWKILSEIDLLLSLQASEDYCLKKMESSKELKTKDFWLRYQVFMRKSIQELIKSQLLHLHI